MTLSRTDKTRTRRPHGAASLGATPEAKRLAAAILEVLAGVRTPVDAARVLGTSIPRYYQLEQRALEGLLSACERRPQGRQVGEAQRLARLEREVSRLEKECGRQQALARVAQRTMGLPAPQTVAAKPNGSAGKKPRRRRPAVRALRAAAALRLDSSSPALVETVKNEASVEGATAVVRD